MANEIIIGYWVVFTLKLCYDCLEDYAIFSLNFLADIRRFCVQHTPHSSVKCHVSQVFFKWKETCSGFRQHWLCFWPSEWLGVWPVLEHRIVGNWMRVCWKSELIRHYSVQPWISESATKSFVLKRFKSSWSANHTNVRVLGQQSNFLATGFLRKYGYFSLDNDYFKW